jgi:hypothetical protein
MTFVWRSLVVLLVVLPCVLGLDNSASEQQKKAGTKQLVPPQDVLAKISPFAPVSNSPKPIPPPRGIKFREYGIFQVL